MRNRNPLTYLNFSQFLSAFADSAVIVLIALMITKNLPVGNSGGHSPYIFLVELFFLFAYVVLAPVVGTFADKNPKARVLLIGNAMKTAGILALILGFSPALSYGIIGIGAAIYGPAKYGILSELTTTNEGLLDANGKLESFTILAIILGTVVGGLLADLSTTGGTIICLLIYLLSMGLTTVIPARKGNLGLRYGREASTFFRDLVRAFRNPTMNFALTGTGAFWMISVVIKNGLFIWIPLHLAISGGFGQSAIIGMVAIGIVIGSLLSKYVTSIESFYRANVYGFIVGALALAFPLLGGESLTARMIVCVILLLIGLFAGLYVIPLNAVLQREGHEIFGVGKTIAIQNFVDNVLMLIGTFAVYYLNMVYHLSITASLITFAVVFLVLMCYLSALSSRLGDR